MHHLSLPDGTSIPALGLGTWRMGEAASAQASEVAAVRLALELGYRLIDTAEMYGEGGAETVVGRALGEALGQGTVSREQLVIVSKVYPHNASRAGTVAACERSLKRLGLDKIDLYLLHWRGQHPLRETVAGMHALQAAGKIGHWGVSNLDVDDMQELQAAGGGSTGAAGCATDQVYYSLGERGVEHSLLPWLREHRMPMLAYSPIDQGALAKDGTLAEIGAARGFTAAQVALAWVLGQPGVLAIPKAVSATHLRENFEAAQIRLSAEERRRIETAYPAPKRKTPLAMI
jgi:diketogulonate reductase-like aldo/keto reductase